MEKVSLSANRVIFQDKFIRKGNDCKQKNLNNVRFKKNGKRPTSHRSTTYLCCVPTLEESAGAGRVGLAGANIQPFYIFASELADIKYRCILLLSILKQ